jgi:hypothetical protein
MVGVHAVANAAEVVKHGALWRFTSEQSIHEAVSLVRLVVKARPAVAVRTA